MQQDQLNLWNVLQQQWHSFWQARQPGERRALLILVTVLALVLIVQLLWTTYNSTARLRYKVPQLQTQVEKLRNQTDEWQRLSQQKAPRSVDLATLQQEINSSLQSFGKAPTLSWSGTQQFQVQGKVNYNAWINWLALLHADYHLRVLQASVSPAGPGTVNVSASLGRGE